MFCLKRLRMFFGRVVGASLAGEQTCLQLLPPQTHYGNFRVCRRILVYFNLVLLKMLQWRGDEIIVWGDNDGVVMVMSMRWLLW